MSKSSIEIGAGFVVAFAMLIWPDPHVYVKWGGLLIGVALILWGMGIPRWLFNLGRRMEAPLIVILIGLAITAFGVVWQISKWQTTIAVTPPPTAVPDGTASTVLPTADTTLDIDRREAIISSLRNTFPDRVIANVTPDYIMDQYKDKMTVEADRAVNPFIGAWHLLTGTVKDITVSRDHRWAMVTFHREIDFRSVVMYFDEEFIDRISVLTSGQTVFALCQLKKSNINQLVFDPCEILDENIGLQSVAR